MKSAEKTSQSEVAISITEQYFSRLTAEIVESADIENLLHPALEALRVYDRNNKSNLFDTLDVYLLNDCNAQLCGRLLFLHRNSLVYRIHRIQEITGVDLSNTEERSYLRLSFLLWKALNNN